VARDGNLSHLSETAIYIHCANVPLALRDRTRECQQYAPPCRGSQRDGFRERGTRHRFLQQLNRDDVYIITPEGLPRLLQEPRRAHQGVTVSRIHLDEDVDVAARVRITSGHRPEESWVRSVVLREQLMELVGVLVEERAESARLTSRNRSIHAARIRRASHVEPELDHIAVGHDVVLALHADLAGGFRG